MNKYTKPPRDGCAAEHSTYPMDPVEHWCGYDAQFDCSECMYTEHGRKNPQSKKYMKNENKL